MMNRDASLSPAQKQNAAQLLLSYVQALAPLLWDAMKTAHISRGITPTEFVQGLYNRQGTGWDPVRRRCANNRPIFQPEWFLDSTKDPYIQLNLKLWLTYLLYGGRRILFRQENAPVFARDQDAFFQFFDIPASYLEKPKHARHLLGNFAQSLRVLLRLGNMFTHLSKETAAVLADDELLQYSTALSHILEPLCQIPWPRQLECQQRQRQLGLLDLRSQPPAAHGEPPAMATLQKNALSGDSQAQVLLGQLCRDERQAMQWYQQAALRQDTTGLYHFGRCCEEGFGTTRDPRRAANFYKAAAAQADPQGQYALARCYLRGIGTPLDIPQALDIFQKLSTQGYGPAMAALGQCYARGIGVTRDFVMATELWLRAFHAGYPPALTQLAISYYRGIGVKRNLRMAFLWFSRAAIEGDGRANYYLGQCFLHGRGTSVDATKALACYETAASQGITQAMYTLGWCHANGIGTEENSLEAINWYAQAAAHGHSGGQVMADVLSRVPRSSSIRQLRKMADRGDATAQYQLAYCLEHGIGMATDARAAYMGYHYAVTWGSKQAMRALGRCYEQGIGTVKNRAAAAWWYQKAVDQGDAVMMYTLAQRALDGSVRLTDSGIRIPKPGDAVTPEREWAAELLCRAADLGNMAAANQLAAM